MRSTPRMTRIKEDSMFRILNGALLIAFFSASIIFGYSLNAASPQGAKGDLASEIRLAMEDPENVFVVIADSRPQPYVDRPGKMAVFPVSGIANVDGNRVTVKAGTFVIADMREIESPKRGAKKLVAHWKSRSSDNFMVFQEGGQKMLYTFFIGQLENDRVFSVERLILAARPK